MPNRHNATIYILKYLLGAGNMRGVEEHIEMNVSDAHKTVNLKIFCWLIILKVRGQRKCYQQNVL